MEPSPAFGPSIVFEAAAAELSAAVRAAVLVAGTVGIPIVLPAVYDALA
jgi:hypothetical protein